PDADDLGRDPEVALARGPGTLDEVDRRDLGGLGQEDPEADGLDAGDVVTRPDRLRQGPGGVDQRALGDVRAPQPAESGQPGDLDEHDRGRSLVAPDPGGLADDQAVPGM